MNTDLVYWDSYYNTVLLVNLVIVIGLFTSIRLFSGKISHINASAELLKKNNAAFGLSMAAVTFSVAILLSGLIYGAPENDLLWSGLSIAGFGVCGIFLMAITRLIFDKITLPNIQLQDEIVKGNVAVSIADAANVIAAAVIIRAIMVWVSDYNIGGVVALCAAYVCSQLILTGMTVLRRKVFAHLNKNTDIEKQLQSGNIALALSFAGRKVGTAFAITIAANLVVYEVYELKTLFLPWIGVCIAVICILKVLTFIAERIILFRIDTKHEILTERNVAIGALEGMIYLSIAILLAEL
jgi:uncharacterized membrane protein YjfL (UPF0719 family)